MPFEGLEAMTHIALVPLEGLHELLMTTCSSLILSGRRLDYIA
jgi:hypothetical protein